MLSTLQMVELEKRQEQGRQEAAKREERERERAEAEAWADREVAAVDLKEVRGCYDAVSATHWLLSLGEALGLAAFCPTEFEMALSLERPERCSVVRTAIHTLLSATKPPSSKDRAASRGGAPPGPPGEYALCGALADRIELWRSLRKSAEEAEQDEHRYLFPEQLRPYTEIGEMAELLDGLGDDLGAVAAQLRAHGLGALDLHQMARLLRLLCEQALMTTPRWAAEAREVHGAAGLEQWLGTGAAGSGKDAPSTGLVYLPQLRRVYSMSCAPPGKSPAWVHPVKDGERVEVEVDEHGTGEVEWRQATVFRLIPGPKGRFQCEVTFADGTPDPDFIETYDRESFEREWRKPPPKAPKKKEAPPEPKKGKGKAKAEEDAKEDGGARARSGRAAATKATEAIKAGPKVVKTDEGGAAAAASAASSAAAAAAPAIAAATAAVEGPGFALVDVPKLLKQLKASKAKRDKTLAEALAAVADEAAEAEAAEARRWVPAAVRLFRDSKLPESFAADKAAAEAAAAAEAKAAAQAEAEAAEAAAIAAAAAGPPATSRRRASSSSAAAPAPAVVKPGRRPPRERPPPSLDRASPKPSRTPEPKEEPAPTPMEEEAPAPTENGAPVPESEPKEEAPAAPMEVVGAAE